MRDLNDKVNGGTLEAAEWNDVPSEIQNVITSAGYTLSSGDLAQLRKAIARYAAAGSFYTDGGTANNYVLSVVGSMQAPTSYFNGMRICFFPTNTSTNVGATVSVNVAGLGAKNMSKRNASAMNVHGVMAGEFIEAVYHEGSDLFIIVNSPLAEFDYPGVNYVASNAQAIAGTETRYAVPPAGLTARLDAERVVKYNPSLVSISNDDDYSPGGLIFTTNLVSGVYLLTATLRVFAASSNGGIRLKIKDNGANVNAWISAIYTNAAGVTSVVELQRTTGEVVIAEADCPASFNITLQGTVSWSGSANFEINFAQALADAGTMGINQFSSIQFFKAS
jgi:hypothetical protein